MNSFNLIVITPKGKAFDDQAESLIVPGITGSFGILAHHAPIVSILSKGIVKIKQQVKESYFAIPSGVLEVNASNEVLMLCDEALEGKSVDDAKDKLAEINA